MNIDFTHLEKLIKIAENANIDSLEVVDGRNRISIECNALSATNKVNNNSSISHTNSDAQQDINEQLSDADSHIINPNNLKSNSEMEQINAPMLGTFYRRSDPSADEFVKIGDTIEIGDTLCVVEAMKILHEVKSTKSGIIQEILANDGDIVEFDNPLFTIKPA